MDQLPSRSKNLLLRLYGSEDDKLSGKDRDKMIEGHVSGCSESAQEFPVDAEWVNSQPLAIHGNLRGQYVLLDFFTYCCINCMHILPALHTLEQDLKDKGLVVVGVHSGKFENEKNASNIKNAVSRYKITHPVLNDGGYEMWNSYQIICWPTLVLISPEGKLLLVSIGESDVSKVVEFVKDVVRIAPARSFSSESLTQEQSCLPGESLLSFPGKVHYHANTGSLYIADTANNRILQVNAIGEVLNRYPSDNDNSTTLDSPQGLLVYDGMLFVCDTNNHRVVQFHLESGKCSVVCGTGVQGQDLEGGRSGPEQEISSPWDLEVVPLQGLPGCQGTLLLIAMAGTHQIWGYALTDVSLTFRGKSTSHKSGETWRLAGNGTEANKNNSYPHNASFAQPSGLSYDGDKTVYIADSESSTIRALELPSFSVKNVVGGGLDPSNLFAFGDADGKGTSAKLQHPIGVACTEAGSGVVADSYNHKLKHVKSRVLSTLDHVTGLSEPSGLSYDRFSEKLFIADTNNHCVKILTPGEGVRELKLSDKKRRAKLVPSSFVDFMSSPVKVRLVLSNKLNKDGPSSVKITCNGSCKSEVESIELTGEPVLEIPLKMSGTRGAVDLLLTLYTCSEEGSCFMDKYTHRINLTRDTENDSDTSLEIIMNSAI